MAKEKKKKLSAKYNGLLAVAKLERATIIMRQFIKRRNMSKSLQRRLITVLMSLASLKFKGQDHEVNIS